MTTSLFAKPVNSDWSIFWILTIFLNIIGLLYIAVWAYQPTNNNIAALGVYTIMIAFSFSGLIFSQFLIIKYGSWFQESLFFVIGFVTWLLINMKGASKSVLSFVTFQQSPLTVVTSNMPMLLSFVFTVFLIPISEELAFLIAIPYILFLLFDQLAKKKSFFRNKTTQTVLTALISGVLFGVFHVGEQNWSFFIGAFIFRFVTVMLVYSFTQYSHITKSLAVGAHIGNNWAAFGFVNGVTILEQNFLPVGAIVTLFLLVLFVTAIGYPIYKVTRKA